MENSLKQYISKFGKFNETEIEAIVQNTQVESFKKGTIILKEGAICDKCYYVLSGCVRQYQVIDGEEKTTAFFTEGQAAVLYSSYLEQKPSQYYLHCIEDCVLTTGTRAQEQKLHQKYPKLEHLIFTLMSHDYSNAQEHIALLYNNKPEERYKILMETQPKLLRRVPLNYLASYIGITPESLSRIRKRILIKEKSK